MEELGVGVCEAGRQKGRDVETGIAQAPIQHLLKYLDRIQLRELSHSFLEVLRVVEDAYKHQPG